MVLACVSVSAPVARAAEPAGTNIVTNGSFEAPVADSSSQTFSAGQSFGGWTVGSGSIDLGPYLKAAVGEQSVDLDGASAGSIVQDLPTSASTKYNLRFAVAGHPDVAPIPGCDHGVKQMEVDWGSTIVATPSFDTAPYSKTNMGWTYHEMHVTATAPTTRLTFTSKTPGGCGPTVDDVSVIPVPVPPVVPPSASTCADSDFFAATGCSPACPAGTELTFWVIQAKGCFVLREQKFVAQKGPDGGSAADGSVEINGMKWTPRSAQGVVELQPPTKTGGPGHVRFSQFGAEPPPGLSRNLLPAEFNVQIPPGEEGSEVEVVKIPPPVQEETSWYGLPVGGDFNFGFGWEKDTHKRYTFVNANLSLPRILRISPPTEGAKGEVHVGFGGRLYDGGWKLGGRVELKNVWLGGLVLRNLCLSYVGGAGKPCVPKVGEEKLFSCGETETKNRWDGAVELAFPSPGKSEKSIALFGGVVDGRLSYIGGRIAGLGIPLAGGFVLDRLGGGLCFRPPPFQLAATVGLNIGGTPADPLMKFDGAFNYINSTPWEVKLRGTLERNERKFITGGIRYVAGRSLEFDVSTAVFFPRRENVDEEKAKSLLSIEGGIKGWMEFSPFKFNIYGNLKICALSLACANGEGVISTRGIGGCLTLTSVPYPWLEKTGSYSWRNLWPYRWVTRYADVRAGGGKQWGGSFQTFASSCDFGNVEEKRTPAAVVAAAATGTSQIDIPGHLAAATIVVKGASHAPSLVLEGPHGRTLAPKAAAELEAGDHDYIEDADHRTSSIVIAKPAGGVWHVRDRKGGTITSIEMARATIPPSIIAEVGEHGHDPYARVLGFTYVPEPSHEIRFVERGGQGIAHDIGLAHGSLCRTHAESRAADAHRPASQYGTPPATHCGTLDFRPAEGPHGTRQILAIVSEHGIPVHEIVVTTYQAPVEAHPAAVHGLHLARHGHTIVVTWAAPPHHDNIAHTAEYNVELGTDDGRSSVHVIHAGHLSAHFDAILPASAVTVKVVPLRDDLGIGTAQTAHLPAEITVPELPAA
jgi:choice-of-anchor C domain-containing protein